MYKRRREYRRKGIKGKDEKMERRRFQSKNKRTVKLRKTKINGESGREREKRNDDKRESQGESKIRGAQ